MFESLTFLILAGILIFREVQHQRQVMDLTLKLTSRTTQEYVAAKKELDEPEVKLPEEKLIPLSEANPNDVLKALESDLHKEEEVTT